MSKRAPGRCFGFPTCELFSLLAASRRRGGELLCELHPRGERHFLHLPTAPYLCWTRASPACSKYREAGFYVSHTPQENDTSEKFYGLGDAGFKDAVLDLTAEDAGTT